MRDDCRMRYQSLVAPHDDILSIPWTRSGGRGGGGGIGKNWGMEERNAAVEGGGEATRKKKTTAGGGDRKKKEETKKAARGIKLIEPTTSSQTSLPSPFRLLWHKLGTCTPTPH